MSDKIDSPNIAPNADLSEVHRKLQTNTVDALKRIFVQSAVLRDIAYDVTSEEIRSQIAIVNGDSIAVYVRRDPYPKFKVIVPADRRTTVATLKQAIQRNHTLQQRRRMQRQKNATHENKPRQAVSTSATVTSSSETSSTSAHHHRGRDDNDDNETIRTKISWKYIWRTYHLECDGTIMREDRQPLVDYGIRNKTVLNFVKKSKADKKMRKKKKEIKTKTQRVYTQ